MLFLFPSLATIIGSDIQGENDRVSGTIGYYYP